MLKLENQSPLYFEPSYPLPSSSPKALSVSTPSLVSSSRFLKALMTQVLGDTMEDERRSISSTRPQARPRSALHSITWLTARAAINLALGCGVAVCNLARNAESFPRPTTVMSFPRIPQWLLCGKSSRYFHSSSPSRPVGQPGPRYCPLRRSPRIARACTQLRLCCIVHLLLVYTRSQAFDCVGGTVGLPHIRLGVSDAFAAEVTFCTLVRGYSHLAILFLEGELRDSKEKKNRASILWCICNFVSVFCCGFRWRRKIFIWSVRV